VDRKTLEYMEERAGKAREICNAIEKLSKEMAKAELTNQVTLYGGGKVIETNHIEIVDGMKQAFVKLAQAEIDKLEKQLANL
jgi:polyhydroxyalkanoate synthesis regulator phasin